MPIYEYVCEECGAEFSELRQSAYRGAPADCPECGGEAEVKLSVPGRFQRGTGWSSRMDGAKMPGRV